MKIKEIIVTPIAIDDPPLLNASGLHAPYALRIVVEIVEESGLTGISEVPGDHDTLRVLNGLKNFINDIDVYDLDNFRFWLKTKFGSSETEHRGLQTWDRRALSHVEAAIEVAAYDLIGKKHNKKVCELLGGQKRPNVPFAGYLFFKYEGAGGDLGFKTNPNSTGWALERQQEVLTPEAIVRQAKCMVETFGFKALKLKGGILEPRLEVDSVLALHQEFGKTMPLRMDPNAVWCYDTALKFGKEMKGVVEYLEDPVRDQSEMARLRKELQIPLATNMATTSFSDLNKSLEYNSEDIILLDHHFWGGFTPSLKMADLANGLGRGISTHSNSHSGISMAAMVHFGAVLPHLSSSLDTHYPWQADDIISGGKIEIKGGSIEIPRGPGLGIELDREKLKLAHEKYLASGLTTRNDEVEMQKVNPEWRFRPIRY